MKTVALLTENSSSRQAVWLGRQLGICWALLKEPVRIGGIVPITTIDAEYQKPRKMVGVITKVRKLRAATAIRRVTIEVA